MAVQYGNTEGISWRLWLRSPQAAVFAYLASRNGATAVEYALIVGGIAVALVVVLYALGDELAQMFGLVQGQLANTQTNM